MKMFVLAAMALAFTATAANAKPLRNTASVGSYTHEITTNLTGSTFFSGKACKDCSSGSALSAQASYLRYWQDRFQIGAEGGIRILSKEFSGSGSGETLFDILGIGAYNFENDFANSIFAKAGLGFYATPKDNGSGYENKLGLFVGVGKRFSWLNNVTYTPELRLVKKGDIDLGIQIEVLNFSIVW